MLMHAIASKDSRRKVGANGFTLVELLVVIVILGILAGVVVFAVSGIKDNGQTAACKTEKRQISTALGAFQAQNTNGDLPASLADLSGTPKYLEEPVAATDWTYTRTDVATATGKDTYTLAATAGGKCA